MYLQQHQVHVKTKTRNENGCSQAAGLDTDDNQRVDAELYETEHLSMLLTLTGFTSQSSLLNHRSPEDTRMLVQTEKKQRSEGRQEASWCRCRKHHLKSKRPAEICSAPPGSKTFTTLHADDQQTHNIQQYQLIFSRVCYTCKKHNHCVGPFNLDSGWVSLGHSELNIIQ